jgi:hypothetical protein
MTLFFRLPREIGKRKPSTLRARRIPLFSYDLPLVLKTASQSSVLFAHRRLPMGKKRKTLCDLCASVVNYPFKYSNRINE